MTSAHLPATPHIKERLGGTGVPPVLHRPEACATGRLSVVSCLGEESLTFPVYSLTLVHKKFPD